MNEHTINGPHYDTVGHDHTKCLLSLPHCGPCWIRGEPRPANPWAKETPQRACGCRMTGDECGDSEKHYQIVRTA